jgi:hypothetical protein
VLDHLGEHDQPVAAELRWLAVTRLGQIPIDVALARARRGQPVLITERVDRRLREGVAQCQGLKRRADVEDPQGPVLAAGQSRLQRLDARDEVVEARPVEAQVLRLRIAERGPVVGGYGTVTLFDFAFLQTNLVPWTVFTFFFTFAW